ncbi:hypothetical protein OSSY52_04490 [Tepiditoga spiralis]|uniref:Secretin/TonB short N-terminal domain-containing protein n=1 Tax=Tepiditoga spiralis TaxID=2108365 RepID=A0A7G1G263_9BACT|nr:STN domain-containing protein [Tepiditoga spiralis]BBE30308.1 hypothetical protein OSSY52_04490 [Tepiditoga spiralis]
MIIKLKKQFIIFFILILIPMYIFSSSKIIDINFYETPLKDAIQSIADGSNSIIIIGPEVKGRVTLSVRGLSVDSALELILYGTTYDYKKISEGIYVVGTLEAQNNISMYLNQPNIIKLKYITTENIKNVLSQYGERVKYIDGADFIVVYGNDKIAKKITDTIEKFDKLGNEYIFLYNIYSLTQSAYQAIQQLNYYDFPVKFENSLNFLQKNFTRLTRIEQTGFIETTNYAKFSIGIDFSKLNGQIAIENNLYSLKTSITTQDSTVLNSFSSTQKVGDTIYAAYNINGAFYLIVYNLLPEIQTSLTKPVGTYAKVNTGIEYTNKLLYTAGLSISDKYVQFSYDFNKDFKILFKSDIVSGINGEMEASLDENSKLNTKISFIEEQKFDPFFMLGKVSLGTSLTIKNNELSPELSNLGYNLGLYWGFMKDVSIIKYINFGIGFDLNYDFNKFNILPEFLVKNKLSFDKTLMYLNFKINKNLNYDINGYVSFEF